LGGLHANWPASALQQLPEQVPSTTPYVQDAGTGEECGKVIVRKEIESPIIFHISSIGSVKAAKPKLDATQGSKQKDAWKGWRENKTQVSQAAPW